MHQPRDEIVPDVDRYAPGCKFFKVVCVVERDDKSRSRYVTQWAEGSKVYRTEWTVGQESFPHYPLEPYVIDEEHAPLCSPLLLHASLHPMGTWPFCNLLDMPAYRSISIHPAVLSFHTVTIPDNCPIYRHRKVPPGLLPHVEWKIGAPRMTMGPPVTGSFRIHGGSVKGHRPSFFSVSNGLLHSPSVYESNAQSFDPVPGLSEPLLPYHITMNDDPEDWMLPAIVLKHGAMWCNEGSPIYFRPFGQDVNLPTFLTIAQWTHDGNCVPLMHRTAFLCMSSDPARDFRSFLASMAFQTLEGLDGMWLPILRLVIPQHFPYRSERHGTPSDYVRLLWDLLVHPGGPMNMDAGFKTLLYILPELVPLKALDLWLILFGTIPDIESSDVEIQKGFLFVCLNHQSSQEDDPLPAAVHFRTVSDALLRFMFTLWPLTGYRTTELMLKNAPDRVSEYAEVLQRLKVLSFD